MQAFGAATFILLLSVAPLAAKPALSDVPRVEDGLLAIAVADKIRRECGELTGRMFRALSTMRQMADHAQSIGYSEDEIRAYVEDDAQKARMRAKRDAYLTAEGVVPTRPDTYCVLGHAEIAKRSQIGALLRKN